MDYRLVFLWDLKSLDSTNVVFKQIQSKFKYIYLYICKILWTDYLLVFLLAQMSMEPTNIKITRKIL